MNACVIIPCYNHDDTLSQVLDKISLPVIVVDDGSTIPVVVDVHTLIRLEKNSGKAKALQVGFKKAASFGFTHAITLDADAQHDASFIDTFLALAEKNPNDLITGVRDFSLAEIPEKRRFLNKFANFWFKFETKTILTDTQCGYRCYPLDLIENLKVSFGRYAYEAEILVKTVWAGRKILTIEIPTIYTQKSLATSHYKPFKDTFQMSIMNSKLSFLSFFPKRFLKKISIKNKC